MRVLKEVTLASGSKLQLVEVGENKFEIRLNGEVQATEFEYFRACETFSGLVDYYS